MDLIEVRGQGDAEAGVSRAVYELGRRASRQLLSSRTRCWPNQTRTWPNWQPVVEAGAYLNLVMDNFQISNIR